MLELRVKGAICAVLTQGGASLVWMDVGEMLADRMVVVGG